MAHGFLQKPLVGIPFLLFKPTLQRGGTCEAHGIGAKSAALLAAPGVLDPTAFYACINILHVLTRGGQGVPRPTKIEAKIFQVGSMLTHFSLLGDFFSLFAGS